MSPRHHASVIIVVVHLRRRSSLLSGNFAPTCATLSIRRSTVRGREPAATRGGLLVCAAYLDDEMRFGTKLFIGFAIGLIAVLRCFYTVAGSVALTETFGKVSDTTQAAGFHVKAPQTGAVLFDVRTQLLETSQDVPTNEGLVVHLDVSVLYRLDPEKVRNIYITVGRDYRDTVLVPELRSAVRNLTSEQSAKALYSEGRTNLVIKVRDQLNEQLLDRGVIIEQVLLRSITFPDQLKNAIESKLKSEQESQQMEFVLQKETQEAERKRIEAQGIADFQKIVSQGISKQLLEWKGIEATERLVESKNAKIVLIGNTRNGLPVVLQEQEGGNSK